LGVTATNTMDATSEAHFDNEAPLTRGAAGAETTVLETKVETSDDTAGLDAGGGGKVGGSSGEASGSAALHMSGSGSESS